MFITRINSADVVAFLQTNWHFLKLLKVVHMLIDHMQFDHILSHMSVFWVSHHRQFDDCNTDEVQHNFWKFDGD